ASFGSRVHRALSLARRKRLSSMLVLRPPQQSGPASMRMPDYDEHDGIGLAALVGSGQVSPDELLEAAIERVERDNPLVNAVVMRLYDHARQAIRAGLPVGPCRGMP